MRIAASLLVGFMCFAAQAVPVQAAVVGMDRLDTTSNVVEAAVRCGPHAHYVGGHRVKGHGYVKGRCVSNRHR